MLILVSYDVSTIDNDGRKRLRQVAKVCVNFGIRVQNSVFECNIDSAQLVELKKQLLNIYDSSKDSLRLYHLGNNFQNKVEHYGAKTTVDVEKPLII